MSVRKLRAESGQFTAELFDANGESVDVVNAFLRHLAARNYSPNTLVAYAHDLQHLWQFLACKGLHWGDFTARHSIELLEHLRAAAATNHVQRLRPAVAVMCEGQPALRLAPATINRILAAVSSFYEFAIMAERYDRNNPIQKCVDHAAQRVPDRHRPFMDGASRQQPMRRRVSVKTVERLPRPLSDIQVAALFDALRSKRDRALLRLMLDGGLRPGEALGLHIEDVSYGRRRVAIRPRNDHPKGVRAKSRFERFVDVLEAETLTAVNDYVMTERPAEASTPFLFLVGGHGSHRFEPLSYPALAKLFARACERAHIRVAWVTPHSLRHTHATRMWEAGMRELTLQKRLGHASPESTRMYTRISDQAVVDDYRKALGLGDPGVTSSQA
ncbi:MAG: tyrosine-type recombinase/integrase [Proteobacteria bacterium]|nr:tyrosine-type recombinase/integrase [Pseudomonadota bacterium]